MQRLIKYIFIGLAAIIWQIAPNTVFAAQPSISETDAAEALQQVKDNIDLVFKQFDKGLSISAKKLSTIGLEGDEAEQVLEDLIQINPSIISCGTVDKFGHIAAIEPQKYYTVIGDDISKQSHIVELYETKQPVFSDIFKSLEGPWSIAIHYPIFDSAHDFIGSVYILFDPKSLFKRATFEYAKSLPANFWVMETDGHIIYSSSNPRTLGLNVFDSNYFQANPGIADISENITLNRNGDGEYKACGKKSAKSSIRKVFWTTVELYKAELRLIIDLKKAAAPEKISTPQTSQTLPQEKPMTREIIKTNKAPAAIGPYSQAIKTGNLVFVSGQIPIDPATGQVAPSQIKTQTRLVLENLKAVLEASGASLETVVKADVFLKSMQDFQAMNEVYTEYFGKSLPARATVAVVTLPKDVLVEISAIAEAA